MDCSNWTLEWTVALLELLSMEFSQARILECVAIFFSRKSSWLKDQIQFSHTASRLFTIWANREVPWKKSYDNLGSILKSRDITLPTKVCLVKTMAFPVVMYGCENWTRKKAERWSTDAFEVWLWRRLLTVPWTTRRSNQFILKEISPGCSLEGLMLKLKLHTLAT